MTTIHRISTALVLVLALAISAASASARPFEINANGSYVPSGAASMRATTPSHSVSRPPVIVRVATPRGFDWGDAGIGAAGGIRALDGRPRRSARRVPKPRPPHPPHYSRAQLTRATRHARS